MPLAIEIDYNTRKEVVSLDNEKHIPIRELCKHFFNSKVDSYLFVSIFPTIKIKI